MRTQKWLLVVALGAMFALPPAVHAGLFGIGVENGSSERLTASPTEKSASPEKARATTDVSDLWWNPSQSGWGMQLVQNNSFVFATLFVYGANGTPTWFTAQLNNVGGFTWSGPLDATTGPWFGAPSFNPALVTVRQAGNMTFTLNDVNNGTVSYTVDGLVVSKSITRQTLVNESIAGVYDAVVNQVQTCVPAVGSGVYIGRTLLTVSQVGNSIVGLTNSAPGSGCTLTGTYSQSGKLGSVAGTYSCTWGEAGTFSLFEIMVTETGMLARLTEQSNLCSSISAKASGIRQ
jgi:hypothetical protein